MEIDLVYLWVNGNDPQWRAKRSARIGVPERKSDVNCEGRYADNDELKYSLRSVEKYAPWIHRIFIVTDNQVPEWLDTSNPGIRIVDHTEIMPAESLPCFNSTLIEHFICRIPGLSEHFLYANDDTFINKPVTPDIFFAEDGFDQLYCRFVEAPRTWVTYVSLLPEEEQKILCEHTALAAASWYADSNEFSENLDVLETAYSSGAEQVVVSRLRSEYENAAV